ncbi:hypothetical protein ACN9MN_07210 [Chryseobacterium sp. S-02]|uniref:hypothetical protein n=1 Tax=Chryseobacterium sp. S-02 TaxID=3404064 RepID=UPI003CEE302D
MIKVSGAKVVMVLGREHCGAIKSAVDNVVQFSGKWKRKRKLKLLVVNITWKQEK